MKKILIAAVLTGLLATSAYVYTQTIDSNKPWSNPVAWKSDPSTTVPGGNIVTIQSGSGIATEVQITVDHASAGANIRNCGGTTHLTPGSSAICLINNPNQPVSMVSDDLSKQSFGTYQLRTQ